MKFSKLLSVVAALTMSVAAAAQTTEPVSPVVRDSVNRAVAVVMAANLDEVLDNLRDAKIPVDRAEVGRYVAMILSGGDPGIARVDANMYIDNMIRANSTYLPDSVSIESQNEFLAQAALLPGAVKTPSGLIFVVVTEGEGVQPVPGDKVNVRYVARLSDGTVFDDTEDEIISFDVDKVIPGFSEGLQMMKPGGTYRLIIPSDLGYGQYGIPGIIPANAVLDFTVTLENINAR